MKDKKNPASSKEGNPWSPQDEGSHYPMMKEWWTIITIFKTPDDYLNASWQQIKKMGSVTEVEFSHLIANESEVFVIVKWIMGNGSSGHTAEMIKVNNNKIKEILIISHDPKFFVDLMKE